MPDPRYTRRVLLCVVGESPAVVTETLFALAVRPEEGRERFVPTEIRIVTTSRGIKKIRSTLLPKCDKRYSRDELCKGFGGEFMRLIADYVDKVPGLKKCKFKANSITLIERKGTPLADIVTAADNESAADTIMNVVKEYVQGELAGSTAIHASIAGGRKSMGFYLGYCMSLFGRPQDRVWHVLVSEPYEKCKGFFYPRPHKHLLRTRDGSRVDGSKAEIRLAPVPIVLLSRLARKLDVPELAYSELVRRIGAELAEPKLTIEVQMTSTAVKCGDLKLPLAGHALAFYVWLAVRRHHGLPGVHHSQVQEDERLIEEYERVARLVAPSIREADGNGYIFDRNPTQTEQYFSNRKTEIEAAMDEELVPSAYRVTGGSGRRRVPSALDHLTPVQIEITGSHRCELLAAVKRPESGRPHGDETPGGEP